MLQRLLFIFMMLVSLSCAQASERYEVELIAFKHYASADDVPENLSYQLPLLSVDHGVNILANILPSQSIPMVIDGAQVFSGSDEITILPKSSLTMNTEMKRLTRNLAFTPLIHLGWSVAVAVTEAGAPSVRILAGKNFQGRYPLSKSQINADVAGPLFELDGLITLYEDQQLYLETELVLREPPQYLGTATQASQASPSLIEFPVKQRQAVNSGDTYYLDHPLLGLLVKIRKI
ncbi:peptidoglycan binding protein CsiV [Motilimonas cestriensis]|uniref:Peptidoglycan binding protein CsiV n=1 Tax=Motilimonas cestriensis TaxID=2742685 RepID=A0ABS8W7C1_9GAMM|nr:CsiV family protein [Motilimonas cestriensis]MCE2593300.1 peptidoglycan binding protein CsiV [Motilimonas cestriensis]